MFFTEKIGHDLTQKDNRFFIVDTCKIVNGWETAIAEIDIEKFTKLWLEEDDKEPTYEDITDWAEEFDCISCWEVVGNYKTKAQASKKHDKFMKNPC